MEINFLERFNTTGVSISGVPILRIVPAGSSFRIETLDTVPLFWIGMEIGTFDDIEKCKEYVIKFLKNKFGHVA